MRVANQIENFQRNSLESRVDWRDEIPHAPDSEHATCVICGDQLADSPIDRGELCDSCFCYRPEPPPGSLPVDRDHCSAQHGLLIGPNSAIRAERRLAYAA